MPCFMLTLKNAEINDLVTIFREFIIELERLKDTLLITQKSKRQQSMIENHNFQECHLT